MEVSLVLVGLAAVSAGLIDAVGTRDEFVDLVRAAHEVARELVSDEQEWRPPEDEDDGHGEQDERPDGADDNLEEHVGVVGTRRLKSAGGSLARDRNVLWPVPGALDGMVDPIWILYGVVGLLVLIWTLEWGLRARDRLGYAYAILTTPQSTIGDASGPRMKLEGTVDRTDGSVTGPVSGTRCLAYRVDVAGVRPLGPSNQLSVPLCSVTGSTRFSVSDGTGAVAVEVGQDAVVSADRASRAKDRAWRVDSLPRRLLDGVEEMRPDPEDYPPSASEAVPDDLEYDEDGSIDLSGTAFDEPIERPSDPMAKLERYGSGWRSPASWLTCTEHSLEAGDTIRLLGPVDGDTAPEGEPRAVFEGGSFLATNRSWNALAASYGVRGLFYVALVIGLYAVVAFFAFLAPA